MLCGYLLCWAVVITSVSSACNSPLPQSSFDVREATISSIHNALFSGLSSCRTVVSSYLARIEAYNGEINAIMSLNPAALRIADEKDELLARGNATGRLHCIPVLLKDNFDTEGLNTTGGAIALRNNRPDADAPTVRALKQEGAVIIGKSSMHELALEGLSVSSLGGQVVNPYAKNRTPGGSSGGTGAAIAASFATFGTGTDTVNSLRSPASANNLYSFRPTRGLISRTGVIPISSTQDTVGAIGRSVSDIATALTVMSSVGYDPADEVTALAPPSSRNHDYLSDLHSGPTATLRGLRLGLLEGFFNRTASNETDPVNDAMATMIAHLTAAGAEVIRINDTTTYNSTAIQSACDVQRFEYRDQLTSYLQRTPRTQGTPRSMPDLYSRNNSNNENNGTFLVIPSQYPFLHSSLSSSPTTNQTTYLPTLQSISLLRLSLHATLTTHSLSFLIYPEQSRLVVPVGSPSQSGRNGILAAVTGFPVITIPAGFSPPSEVAPRGVPIGMEILGRPWEEGMLLGIAKRVEELRLGGSRGGRRMPQGVEGVVEVPGGGYEGVPDVRPEGGSVPREYPVGVLG